MLLDRSPGRQTKIQVAGPNRSNRQQNQADQLGGDPDRERDICRTEEGPGIAVGGCSEKNGVLNC